DGAYGGPGKEGQQRAAIAMRQPGPYQSHHLLLRYEVALDRQFTRALRELQNLRAKRTQQVVETKPAPLNKDPEKAGKMGTDYEFPRPSTPPGLAMPASGNSLSVPIFPTSSFFPTNHAQPILSQAPPHANTSIE